MQSDTEILNWVITNGGFSDDPDIVQYAEENAISLETAVREVITEIIENPGDAAQEDQLNLFDS